MACSHDARVTPTLSAGGSALVLWGRFCWCHIEGLNPSNCHCDASGKSHETGKTRSLPWGAQPAPEQPVDAANPAACPRACGGVRLHSWRPALPRAGHLTALTGVQRWPGGLCRPPGEGSGTGGPGPRCWANCACPAPSQSQASPAGHQPGTGSDRDSSWEQTFPVQTTVQNWGLRSALLPESETTVLLTDQGWCLHGLRPSRCVNPELEYFNSKPTLSHMLGGERVLIPSVWLFWLPCVD